MQKNTKPPPHTTHIHIPPPPPPLTYPHDPRTMCASHFLCLIIVMIQLVSCGEFFEEFKRKAVAEQMTPGVWKWTHYFEAYDNHLTRFRGASAVIVEVGVAGGGSLKM